MLNNKIALVTGASRGIGAGIARELAANGATVIMAARTAKPGTGTSWGEQGGPTVAGSLADNLAAIQAAGGRAESYSIDLLNNNEIEKMIDYVSSRYQRIDILVNCAMGFPKSYKGTIWDCDLSDWTAMMDVGVRSKFMLAHFVSKLMVEQQSGLIAQVARINECKRDVGDPFLGPYQGHGLCCGIQG